MSDEIINKSENVENILNGFKDALKNVKIIERIINIISIIKNYKKF